MKSTKKEFQIPVWYLFLSFLCLFLSTGCSDDNKKNEIPDNWISELPGSIEFDVKGGTK
mgnify:CR=1 FL=1